MIFSEIYGVYYNTVAKILTKAIENPISREEMRKIIEDNAFSESILSIEPSLINENWQLLSSNGKTVLKNKPTMPITDLEKRWLKAISLDKRIKLFKFDFSWLDDVVPLFTQNDIYIFDRYSDGDNFEDEKYIKTFHLILESIKNHQPLTINVRNRNEKIIHLKAMPKKLEYSEKVDKFRLITSCCRYVRVINLGKIISCKPFNGELYNKDILDVQENRTIIIELTDERNTLERALLHFAHFQKQAIRLDENHYKIKINYNKDDETEMVIRVLSFGPYIKVCEPTEFVNLIKERLLKQKNCGLN